ncbi:gamma-glutamylcyclotransferase family protein [Thermoflavimicrobium dichotomicum]|uniref:Uncharacterized conserved protein YtfP, gamma-glutamylcyclotransferase (GGCT)/AIG2-like family n=1 Tax=Thermoflavimicrobium dichotomicum TaxID=46223 RepID=A0A1I3R9V4_9BACL|nr:gamma-glutamylcyclotransferase family protein [Thermoflavimicrobium dichotomicum]SFJ43098.1 Uncharacterized conserved protein YtfP, gamma-glutamylcyclotransferase (GGCT)/AIG2-like family [Thermoflavimicrobium dichotomicum]
MYLFAYGSLRMGMKYHDVLRGARLAFPRAWVQGALYDTREGYPGMIAGQDQVMGEIYQIDLAILKRVDELEDYYGLSHPDNLYERVEMLVHLPEQEQIPAFVYFYKDRDFLIKKGIYIHSGDWAQYVMQVGKDSF